MNTLKLYLHSMRMLLKSHLQYPSSFLLQTFAQLIMTGGELMAVVLLIDRFDTLNHWTGPDLMIFFGVMNITHYLTEFLGRGITGNFSHLIRTGMLDTYLARPRGVLTQVLLSAIDPRRVSCVAVGVGAVILGSRQLALQWTSLKILALTESILFGSMLTMALFMIEAIVAVHSVKSIEAVNVLTYGGRSACQYPIDVYPRPLKLLFMVVAPYALTLHAPVSFILDKMLFGWPAYWAFLTPLVGLFFFLLMYLLFRRALLFYRSTGS